MWRVEPVSVDRSGRRLRAAVTGIVGITIMIMIVGLGSTPAAADPGPKATDDGGDGWAHAGLAPGETPSASTQGVQSTGATVRGLDVSHYQGTISWPAVAAAGAKFAFAKAPDGLTYVDPFYSQNRAGARANGVYLGGYSFGRPDRGDPRGQANLLVNTSGYAADGLSLPPMLDIEWPSGSTPACYGLSVPAMSGWIRAFVDQVLVRTGRAAVIYTATSWWNQCTGGDASFGANPLFIARWASTPGTLPPGWPSYTFWQYDDKGSLPGDPDVFNGTQSDLDNFVARPNPLIAAAVPSDLSATAGPARVTLTWTGARTTAYAPVTSYRIYRNGTLLATSVTPTYVDTTAVNDTSYSYTVTALGAGGESAQSDAAAATPRSDLPEPTVPTGLTATADAARVTLVWAAVPSAAEYRIYRNDTLWKSTTNTTYVDTEVSNATTYRYAVSAYSDPVESQLSATVSAQPDVAVARISLSASTVPAGQPITLTVTGIQAGLPATVYESYQVLAPVLQRIPRRESYVVQVQQTLQVPAKYATRRVKQVYYVTKTTCRNRSGRRVCVTKRVRKTRTVRQTYVSKWRTVTQTVNETRVRTVYDTATVVILTDRTRTIGTYPAAANWRIDTTFTLADAPGQHIITVTAIGLSSSLTATRQ